MRLIGWMLDLAREQAPREHELELLLERSLAAGYNAVGLYLEHRFAYPSKPWASAPGALQPDSVKRLHASFHPRGLRLIPFLNTLGHMEGFINSQGGQLLAEGPRHGGPLQLCPSRPESLALVHALVLDAVEAFDDPWVHLGGDETERFGRCRRCNGWVAERGRGGLYGDYYGELCRWVLERGRRPCLWGDMLLRYPRALDAIPRETVIFDWQYRHGPADSTRIFLERGHEVVCCPTLHSWSSGWCRLETSRRNIDEHAAAAVALNATGVLLTTWELHGFSSLGAILPLVEATGRHLARGELWQPALEHGAGEAWAEAAELLGVKLLEASPFLAAADNRLRKHLVLGLNPFSLWLAWSEGACGAEGDRVLEVCEQAQALLTADEPLHFAAELHRVGVLWVRVVEEAYRHYADGDTLAAADALVPGRELFERLRPGLARAEAHGGSIADPARLEALLEWVARVRQRLKALPDASEQRPAFELLLDANYLPGDQAAWRHSGV